MCMHWVDEQVLAWSFTVLAAGVYPARDHVGKPFSDTYDPIRHKLAGEPIAGGCRAALFEYRGRPFCRVTLSRTSHVTNAQGMMLHHSQHAGYHWFHVQVTIFQMISIIFMDAT
jgi:hypothetical protein